MGWLQGNQGMSYNNVKFALCTRPSTQAGVGDGEKSCRSDIKDLVKKQMANGMYCSDRGLY